MPGYSSPTAKSIRLRSVIPIVLTVIGFAGGFAVAVFYNTALRPVPFDSTLPAPSQTTASPGETVLSPRLYRSTTDGSGAYENTPAGRASARAARAERVRLDTVMRICSGC